MTDEMFSISFLAYTRASSVVNDRIYLYKVGDDIQGGKTGRRRKKKFIKLNATHVTVKASMILPACDGAQVYGEGAEE